MAVLAPKLFDTDKVLPHLQELNENHPGNPSTAKDLIDKLTSIDC